nr:MAG TPA: Major capsid protein [Caudoviricetes sp.]
MAHTAQERYSSLVDAKLRASLVTRDNFIFNNRYEGTPKAGKVKIPVRSTEVSAKDYNKASGVDLDTGTTTYLDLDVNKDKAVNELIDGFDAASVPDGIVAERLDSAGYSLASVMDADSIMALETGGTLNVGAASTSNTIYGAIVDARSALSENGVPTEGRWLIVSPAIYGLLLKDTTNFIRQSDLSQELVQSGAVGKIAGFVVYESARLAKDDATITSGKKTTVEFIAGHPNWCHRVDEWSVPVHIQDLAGSGKYIGASAVQGRKVYGVKVSNKGAVYIKAVQATV